MNVSNVADMNIMFSDACMFNQTINDWNVYPIQNMSNRFQMRIVIGPTSAMV